MSLALPKMYKPLGALRLAQKQNELKMNAFIFEASDFPIDNGSQGLVYVHFVIGQGF